MSNSKLYLVYGDICFDPLGSYFQVFGAFTSKERAIEVKNQKEEEYFLQEYKSKDSEIKARHDIQFEIMEIEVDEIIQKDIGGYIE